MTGFLFRVEIVGWYRYRYFLPLFLSFHRRARLVDYVDGEGEFDT